MLNSTLWKKVEVQVRSDRVRDHQGSDADSDSGMGTDADVDAGCGTGPAIGAAGIPEDKACSSTDDSAKVKAMKMLMLMLMLIPKKDCLRAVAGSNVIGDPK
jgi:hypothetical protein